MGVPSGPMAQLEVSVESGVFSHERLVRFLDASGSEYTALVDERVTSNQGGHQFLRVRPTARREREVLVALPTADGERVWVASDRLAE